ncbi:hypothetical protein ACFOLL_01780 [Falsochrobactrum ovis]|uniref:Lipoprotein n=1 Tax=Falsochrobactrum ovis TaxID=1293442 RepID=A0A364JXD3_9HYPH|nr:hypothetical protein [Falsochrobactrum ovis]RAK32124.1 hypothetical protein C7374_102120 [Falsochrobactrum ovis]
MKKILITSIAALSFLAIAGCNDNSSDNATPPATTPEAPADGNTTPPATPATPDTGTAPAN